MWLVGLLALVALLIAVHGGRSTWRDFRDDRWGWTLAGAGATIGGIVSLAFSAVMIWQFVRAGGL